MFDLHKVTVILDGEPVLITGVKGIKGTPQDPVDTPQPHKEFELQFERADGSIGTKTVPADANIKRVRKPRVVA